MDRRGRSGAEARDQKMNKIFKKKKRKLENKLISDIITVDPQGIKRESDHVSTDLSTIMFVGAFTH